MEWQAKKPPEDSTINKRVPLLIFVKQNTTFLFTHCVTGSSWVVLQTDMLLGINFTFT